MKGDRQRARLIVGRDTWAKQDYATVTREQMQAWIDAREASGKKPATVNREAALVGAICKWGIRANKVSRNLMDHLNPTSQICFEKTLWPAKLWPRAR